MRKVFIDGGANVGQSIIAFCDHYPNADEYEIICFEASSSPMVLGPLGDIIRQYQNKAKSIELNNKALWTRYGLVAFYDKGTESSSILHRDQFTNNPNVIKRNVECVDLSSWIKNNFTKDDYVVLKLDIEGGEYDVIRKMYDDETIGCVDRFYCEIHGIKCGKDYQESLDLVKMVEESGNSLYEWRIDYLGTESDRKYSEDVLRNDFLRYYARYIKNTLEKFDGELPFNLCPKKMLKAIEHMLRERTNAGVFGSMQTTGAGHVINPHCDYYLRLVMLGYHGAIQITPWWHMLWWNNWSSDRIQKKIRKDS